MIELIKQLSRFGIVGVIAATIHFSIVVFLVQQVQLQPLTANVFGFFISFQVSYWGHRTFTFSNTNVHHRSALPKLLLLQMFNFAANQSLYYMFLSMHLPYQFALLLVLAILPLFTFVVSKLWIFRSSYSSPI